jgi:DNA polymerase-3 subunit chi
VTRVDFYLIEDATAAGRQRAACRLADKAYRLGHRVYIHAGDAQEARRLDDLLWTFSAGAFVPHRLVSADAPDAAGETVLIGHEEPPAGVNGVLISLQEDVPPCFSRFERMVELVTSDEADRRRARERYRFYRDRGYPLEKHEVAL